MFLMIVDLSEEELIRLGFLGEGELIHRYTRPFLTRYCSSIL